MAAATTEHRVSKLEQGFALISKEVNDLATNFSSFAQEQRDFRQEWRRTKEAEAASAIEKAQAEAREKEKHAVSQRITLPQIVAMAAAMVTSTAVVMGGLMWMINSVAGTVRSDMLAQQAQIGLQVRGMADSISAAHTSIQMLQQNIALDRVKLGLVEHSAANSARVVQGMEGYDASLARHDEQIKAIQQAIRDLTARHGRPP